MIKFKEHDGLLFKMLEEPVPLKENDENVLVRFITHGVIGEYVREHWLDCNQKNVPIYVEGVDSDGDVTVWIENGNEHHCCPFPMFEIIGTPVAEGSEDWALYQMMQGRKVCCSNVAYKALSMGSTTNIGAYYIGHPIHGGYYCTVDTFLLESVKTGWRIYEEPKPLLADAGIGDIVKTNLGDWLQIVDTPCLRFGHDECHRTHDGLYWDECGVCDVDSTYRLVAVEPLATEGTAEWAWQMMLLSNMVIPIINPQTPWKLIDNRAETEISCASHTRENWIKVASDRVWQIYKEQKPESQYKVGDWVEYRLHANTAASDNNMMGQIIDIGRIGGTSIEVLPVGNYEHNTSLSTYHVIYASRIIRKLKPSEVIVNIGCLSGTVEDLSYEENGKFWLIGKATERHPIDMYVILYDEMLDTETRELVEGLLKAQKIKKTKEEEC